MNATLIRDALDRREMRIESLASEIGRSLTFTRALINGQAPVRNAKAVINKLGKALDLKPEKLLVQGGRTKV